MGVTHIALALANTRYDSVHELAIMRSNDSETVARLKAGQAVADGQSALRDGAARGWPRGTPPIGGAADAD